MFIFIRRVVIASAVLALTACSMMSPNSDSIQDSSEGQGALATNAANVLAREMSEPRDKRIPQELVNKARCIAVFPSVIEAGFILGARRGKGLVSCHQGSSGWSQAAPAVYTVSGGSVGLQAGASSSSVVLLFLTRDSLDGLLESEIKLGSEIGVTAGPIGFNADVSSAPSPVVSYVTSKNGLFAGINLSGSRLSFNESANADIYQTEVSPSSILLNTNTVPASVGPYVDAVQGFVSSHQP